MRRASLLGCLVAAAAFAPAAGADRVVTGPGNVLALARSGYSVVFLSAPGRGHCAPSLRLWDLAGRGVWKLGRHGDSLCTSRPSTGSGIAGIAVAGNRAVWLAYAGGNDRDWILYTATRTRPTERRLAFRTADVDAPPPIVLGTASQSAIPYAVGSSVRVIAADGRRLYTWQAPGPVTNLTAYGSEVAVFVRGGHCFVLSPSGAVAQSYSFAPGSVQQFALGGRGLVVQLPGGRIEVRRGASVHRFSISPQARMLDYAGNILLYRIGDAVHGRFLW